MDARDKSSGGLPIEDGENMNMKKVLGGTVAAATVVSAMMAYRDGKKMHALSYVGVSTVLLGLMLSE